MFSGSGFLCGAGGRSVFTVQVLEQIFVVTDFFNIKIVIWGRLINTF